MAQQPDDRMVQGFIRFLVDLRRKHIRFEGEHDGLEEVVVDPVAKANFDRIPGATALLTASLLERQGKFSEALLILDDLPDLPPALEAIRTFLIAGSLVGKGHSAEAVGLYLQVLEDPSFTLRGMVYHNLGNIYLDERNFDQAATAYRMALEDAHLDAPGLTWHNLGRVFWQMGDDEGALNAYRRAIEDPEYTKFAGEGWIGIGVALYVVGKFSEAREAFLRSLALPDPSGATHERARARLELLQSDLPLASLSREDRVMLLQQAPSAAFEPEQRILAKLEAAKLTQYDNYLQKKGSGRENVLSILRGWSSAVTLLEGSERLWRGGGYLIRWAGKGIAIDPGFDFLRNLHDAGYHGRDIDAVLVSHNHPDHNADLTRLDDLRYELFKRRRMDPHGAVESYVLLWDRDSQRAISFSTEQPEHQYRPILFDLGRANPTDTIMAPHGLPFSVTYFEVKHGDLHHAVGFKLELQGENRVTIGYTGDTEFFAELPDLLQNCDVLLAHISQPDPEEFTDPKRMKRHHLGYRGLAELIKRAQPKLTLVGEFWAGLADLRIDLVQGLRRLSGTTAILPAGVGLHLLLPHLHVECTQCKRETSFQDIRVAPPTATYGDLSYLCTRCILQ